VKRRLPVGAEAQRGGGAHFRVWAPNRRVEVLIEGAATPLEREPDGYHSALVATARGGTRYKYRLDGKGVFPDPASRSQPDGPHGDSEVVDPSRYEWRSAVGCGVKIKGQVLYEIHVGTFTREGTFAAARGELQRLRDLGVTLLELLPLAEFPGAFGWGYDGVDLYAPSHLYGAPDDLRGFIDAAHALGLGVILDVVYNHFGPDGCFVQEFSPAYFSDAHATDWGRAINFDGPQSAPVREFFVANAGYWIDEFRFDGLRLDATQSIFDSSPEHVLTAIAARAREAASGRSIVLVAENEPQRAELVRPVERGGNGLDALWNDDYHHAALAAATGSAEAYYSDTDGTPQQLVSAVKWGFLFQGQRYAWQKGARGAPALDLASAAFVTFLENHDQVANSVRGARLWQRTAPGVHRALVALTLLAPQTPMLFQGEELGASAPFLYFADHDKPALSALVRKGRADFLTQFPALANEPARATLSDPGARETFLRCKLDSRKEPKPQFLALYRDLLRLRREDPAFAQQRGDLVHGTVLGPRAFALRFLAEEGGQADRLVLVNLGGTLQLGSIADPLVAPPMGDHWRTIWSSQDVAYGGDGVGPVDGADGWRIGGCETTVLAPSGATRGGPWKQ
jgi:maltooligosyltrehalose trehalohydrolase